MATVQTTIRLPAELREQLQRKADSRGYTLKDLTVFILRDHLAHRTIHQEPQDHPDNTQ